MITEGCTKKYNKWVGNPSPPVIAATLKKVSYNYGLRHGEGFLISSMRPAMFLRKRLCMFFSSMSRSFITGFMVAAAMAAEWGYARCWMGGGAGEGRGRCCWSVLNLN